VPSPESERERDQRDQQQRGDDAADSRPALALCVEVALGEDEQRDQGQERQPLQLRVPDAVEVGRAAVVDVTEDKRGEQPDPEPDDVEDPAGARVSSPRA
jgi:hypothetical protein